MKLAGARFVCGALLALAASAASAQTDAAPRGREVFAHFCVRCHGANADGQSELAQLLTPKPANLRVSKLDPAQQALIVIYGGAARGRSPGMPAWGDQLSGDDVTAIVHFLQSLRTDERK